MQEIRNNQFNLEAEKSVLAGILLDNKCAEFAIESLNFNEFYSEEHKKIFNSVKNLDAAGIAIDIITIQEDLKYNSINLKTLLDNHSTFEHFKYYLNIVKEKSKRRNLIETCNKAIENCETGLDLEESIEILNKIKINDDDNFKITESADLGHILLDYYERGVSGEFKALKTGYASIDAKIGGFEKGSLNIIGAGTSIGKSMFALNLALNFLRDNKKVCIFSLEMRKEQIANRIISNMTNIYAYKIKDFVLTQYERQEYMNACEQLSKYKFLINDTFRINIESMKGILKKINKKDKIDVVIVDYLQQLQTKSKTLREQEVATITRELKILSEEFNCVFIAMSQLNRASSARQDKQPQLSDLRESGAIEQDADSVMFLHRDSLESNICDVIIAKNRHGETGKCQLAFKGQYQRFEEL